MPLPSQMPRTSRQVSLRTGSGRRAPGGLKAVIGAGLLVAAAIGGWSYFKYQNASPAQVSTEPGASVLPVSEPIGLSLGQPKQTVPNLATERQVLATDTPRPAPTSPVGSAPSGPAASLTVGQTSTPVPSGPATTSSTTPGTTNAAPATDAAPSASPSQPGGTTSIAGDPAGGARDAAVARLISSGEAAMSGGRLVEARANFNRALHHPRANDADTAWLRQTISGINDNLLFSTAVTPGDPLVEAYIVQPGDRLATIVRTQNTRTDWRFVQRVNKMADPGRLRAGQKLKLVKGPFHAVVFKSSYRLDLYADATDSDGNRLYIRSFNVGLGEHNSTPTGRWVVRPASRLVNPPWVNPRTGERFGADDPKNPIGEFWVGIQGADKNTEVLAGYGIHGTIEPESIGTDASMGCVRLRHDDIALVYEVLVEGGSQVEILP